MLRKIFKKCVKAFFFQGVFFLLILTGCYSVYEGGTGGIVVDEESTLVPKQGISSVDIYAYTDLSSRDSDFSSWKEGSVFKPSSAYYGHTSSGNDGSFSISKIIWKSYNPAFGKDADFTRLYLLFYHENYGLTKGETLIVSGSTSDTVYQELKSVRKRTSLTVKMVDISSEENTSKSVYVKIKVPQKTETITEANDLVYDGTVTGSGTFSITYPRYKNEEDRLNGVENSPEIAVVYYQMSDLPEWKACNYDPENENFTFLDFESDESNAIKKTVKSDSYSVTLFGKTTIGDYPLISGQYISSSSEADDGLSVFLMGKDSDGNYSRNLGSTTTESQTIGTSSSQRHGVFASLTSTEKWKNYSYSGKYFSIPVKLIVRDSSGTEKAGLECELLSNQDSVNVQIK